MEIVGGQGGAQELQSLLDWLDHEPALRGRVEPMLRVVPSGELGGLMDAVQVAVGGGGAVAVLASALRAWFAQPRGADLRVKITRKGGRTVEVDAKRVRDVEALLRGILADDEDGAGGPP
ncbi:hypothetical protein GCM10010168_62650 [Actinoplanes ianthinogenes]|uniref:Uncharacterized protein n=1 Tax=Actinoplanes ianthinogenes TaxID=122358 RepID=A0ABM7LJP9_9ACTN|nr:hypothetical protein Aiant_01440 [Actinoplanes ianthinogenes]GGR35746.1 hypothetical protein GCM10010168_62650 [Actinoplanes ianthinogenes]